MTGCIDAGAGAGVGVGADAGVGAGTGTGTSTGVEQVRDVDAATERTCPRMVGSTLMCDPFCVSIFNRSKCPLGGASPNRPFGRITSPKPRANPVRPARARVGERVGEVYE